MKLNEEFEIIVKFKNPLNEKLTKGVLHIEGHGIARSHVIPLKYVARTCTIRSLLLTRA